MGDFPQYHIDRMAAAAGRRQKLINLFRRLLFLPIRRTSAEAERDLRQEMDLD